MGFKTLDIKAPCGQDWDRMKVEETGRMCNRCNNIVHDFSQLSDAELLEALQSGKYSCGRFEASQLGTLYYVNEEKTKRKKYWAAIAASIVAGLFQVSSVQAQQPVTKMKLYGAETNFNKPESNTQTTTQDHDSIAKAHVLTMVVKGKSKSSQHRWAPLSNVDIEIIELSTIGFTDNSGESIFDIDDKDWDKLYTIVFSAYGYHKKTIKVKFSQLKDDRLEVTLRTKKEDQRVYTLGFY